MKNQTLKRAILTVLGVGGILTLAVVAPNTVQLLKYVIKNPKSKWNHTYYVKGVVHRLANDGLVLFAKNHQGQTVVGLTLKGKKELKQYETEEKVIERPKRWDGKYRLIIFDIKEWKRATRDGLRGWLRHLGFVRLQNSVWVFPYECREVIVLLKSKFKIGREVLYLTADFLENDRWLRKEFGLN